MILGINLIFERGNTFYLSIISYNNGNIYHISNIQTEIQEIKYYQPESKCLTRYIFKKKKFSPILLQESEDVFIFYCFLHLDLLKYFLPGITCRPLFAMMWTFFIFSYIKIQWVASIFVSATLACYYLFKRLSLRLQEQ